MAAQAPAAAKAPPAAPADDTKPPAIKQMEESIARQKAAIAKQAGPAPAGGFFTVSWMSLPPLPVAAQPDCPALGPAEIEPLVTVAATARQLKPELLKAVIRAESAFRPCAVSSKGAMGLMQIMPEIAEKYGVTDPFDPAGNIDAGAQYLKQLMERYQGDLKLSLAAYNAGPTRVDGSTPNVPRIPETQGYVDQILQELGMAGAGASPQSPAK